VQNAQGFGKWVFFSSTAFGVLGVVSVLVTDFIFIPGAPGQSAGVYLSREPIILASTSLPPALFACYASLKWLRNGSKFFRGWLSVAVFAWLSLLINPIIWVLVVATFTLYGFVVLSLFLAGGVLLEIAWRIFRRAEHA
jgi:hypothetical protein